jgi:subtilisin family serine protease
MKSAVARSLVATVCISVLPFLAWSRADEVAFYHLDPNRSVQCQSYLETDNPSIFNGASVNQYLGANRFYSAGITGQNTTVANVEAGWIWGTTSGHESLQHVVSYYADTANGALGDIDRHATWVGMMIGGRSNGGGDHQTGIAYSTDLRSGAIATGWNPSDPPGSYSGNFSANTATFLNAYNNYFVTNPVDVINSSWGYTDSTGMDGWTMALDGFSRAHPQTTFVVSAGNSGPGTNTVGGPASGWNGISVGALANNGSNQYNTIASFSSRGPQDYADPLNGTISGVRAAVDIVAPGASLVSAFYGGSTGGNTGNPTSGGPTYYSSGLQGTSFAAPIVAGAVALLDSASRVNSLGANSRDSRVIRSVLLNSADKNLPGWSNGQTTISGVITTTQSLDWTLGAGRLNLDAAYDQYLSGTKDVAGSGGGAILPVGWDFAALSGVGTYNDYLFGQPLEGGTSMTVTLSWFRNREVDVVGSTVSDLGFANLDLEVWNASFTQLIATSKSTYNSVEELFFTLPSDGYYGLRVGYTSQVFGSAVPENYGLAWWGTATDVLVPEPASLVLAAVGLIVLLAARRWPRGRSY